MTDTKLYIYLNQEGHRSILTVWYIVLSTVYCIIKQFLIHGETRLSVLMYARCYGTILTCVTEKEE